MEAEKSWDGTEVLTPGRFVESYPSVAYSNATAPEDVFEAAAAELGLVLRREGPRDRLVLDEGRVVGRLMGTGSSLNSRAAIRISRDKPTAVQRLAAAGVPVPLQRVFAAGDVDAGVRFAAELGFDVVVKPLAGSGGAGVSVEIGGEPEFRRAWSNVLALPRKLHRGRVVVERRHAGVDVRAVVVGGTFVCGVTRVPANVVGDGVATVRQLIALRNRARRKDRYYSRHPIRLDRVYEQRLSAKGIELEDVPPAGTRVFLTSVANIHLGADVYDVTDLLPAGVIGIAERAARAIPGLGFAGIDLIVPDMTGHTSPVVIEVNAAANLNPHYRPAVGKARAPALDVLREMRAHPEVRSTWDHLHGHASKLFQRVVGRQ